MWPSISTSVHSNWTQVDSMKRGVCKKCHVDCLWIFKYCSCARACVFWQSITLSIIWSIPFHVWDLDLFFWIIPRNTKRFTSLLIKMANFLMASKVKQETFAPIMDCNTMTETNHYKNKHHHHHHHQWLPLTFHNVFFVRHEIYGRKLCASFWFKPKLAVYPPAGVHMLYETLHSRANEIHATFI